MRKSVFILLTVFMACLLCKESENMPGTSRKFMDETFLNRGEENFLPGNGNVNISIPI